jgi:hypothetical protein
MKWSRAHPMLGPTLPTHTVALLNTTVAPTHLWHQAVILVRQVVSVNRLGKKFFLVGDLSGVEVLVLRHGKSKGDTRGQDEESRSTPELHG